MLFSMVDCDVDLADSPHYMQFQALDAAFTGHCFGLGRHDSVPHDQPVLRLTFGGSLVIFTPFCRMLTGNLGEG